MADSELPIKFARRQKKNIPDVWAKIISEYPAQEGKPSYGIGAGQTYSAAGFISQALLYFEQDTKPKIIKGYLDSTNVVFDGITPGSQSGWLAICAWKTEI